MSVVDGGLVVERGDMGSREVEEDLDWENTTDAYTDIPGNDTDYANKTTPIYSIGPDFIVQWLVTQSRRSCWLINNIVLKPEISFF